MMANPYFVLASIKKESKRKTHAKFINLVISTWSDLSQMSRKTQMLFYRVLYTRLMQHVKVLRKTKVGLYQNYFINTNLILYSPISPHYDSESL